MRGSRKGRRLHLLRRHWGIASSFAGSLPLDLPTAKKITERAFARSFMRFAHLREPHEFEITLLDQVIRAARRQVGRGGRESVDRDAVFYLEHILELPGSAIAEILDVTERRADRLRSEPSGRPLTSPRIDPPTDAARRRIGRAAWVTPAVTLVAMAAIGFTVVTRSTAPPTTTQRATDRIVALDTLPEVVAPFAPTDDPVVAASGFAGGRRWLLRVFTARHHTICLELRVDEQFGDAHCLNSYDDRVRLFVAADRKRAMTFVYGYAAEEVAGIHIAEARSAPFNVELDEVPDPFRQDGPDKVFLISLPDYLLQMLDRAQGRSLGYRVHTLRLQARGIEGDLIRKTVLHLGRPD